MWQRVRGGKGVGGMGGGWKNETEEGELGVGWWAGEKKGTRGEEKR